MHCKLEAEPVSHQLNRETVTKLRETDSSRDPEIECRGGIVIIKLCGGSSLIYAPPVIGASPVGPESLRTWLGEAFQESPVTERTGLINISTMETSHMGKYVRV